MTYTFQKDYIQASFSISAVLCQKPYVGSQDSSGVRISLVSPLGGGTNAFMLGSYIEQRE
jgi:hypothetical protein